MLGILIAAVAAMVPAGVFAARTHVLRDDLSNLHVNALAQDSLGYIWVGTANGLCRDKGKGYDIFFSDKSDPATIPSNNVTALRYDNGVLWVATARGVASKAADSNSFIRYSVKSDKLAEGYYRGFFRFNGKLYTYGYNGLYEIDTESHTLVPRVSFDHRDIEAAAIDSSGNLWVSSGNELVCLDPQLHIVKRIALPESNLTSAMLPDGDDIILGTQSGLMLLRPSLSSVMPMPGASALREIPINTVLPLGETDRILVGTRGRGPLVFDKSTGSLIDLNSKTSFGDVLSIDITALILDKEHNLWLGTFDKGVFMMSNRSSTFNNDRKLIDAFKDSFITRVTGDDRGNLWIGTRYRGLSCVDRATGKVTAFTRTDTPWLSHFPAQFVQEIFIDSSGRLWVGMDDGLFTCRPGAGPSLSNPRIFPHSGNVVTIAEAPDHTVWVGYSDRGIRRFSPDGEPIDKPGSSPLFTSDNITRILPYDESHMLVASFLDNIYLVNTENFTATALDSEFQQQWDMAIDVFQSRNGTLWIGTYDNGLLAYNPRNRQFRHYTDFKSHDILAVREDSHGNIWCSSSYGIYRIDPQSGGITSYLKQDGIPGNQYHEKCSYTDADGFIFFGGNYGLQQIQPDNVTTLRHNIPIYLTELRTLNREADNDEITQTDLPFLKKLDLDYDNNALSIGFTGLNYNSPVEYAYMLEGFDKMWIYTGEYNHAIYSNLPPGNYSFLVKVKENDLWSDPTHLLSVSVAEAPWLHPLAKTAYLLLAIVMIVLLTQLYIRLRLEKERLTLAEKKVEDERQMSQRKVNFFNNISHELRTPITLIYAPVKYLHKNHRNLSQQEIENTLDYIDKNVDRLLALTTQILKFRTVQGETLPLKVGEYDPVTQIDNIIRLYNIYAAEKDLSVTFTSSREPFKAVYDSDKLEKIINNLLFNAVKYTPPKGHITVRLDVTDNPEGVVDNRLGTYMEIQVIDDGVGIPADQDQSLFTRFKRFINPFSFRKEGGFGIGLNFVKNLVAKHHGVITHRANTVKGTTFIVDIPIMREAYDESEWISDTDDEEMTATSVGDHNPVVPTTLSDEVVAAAAVAAAADEVPDDDSDSATETSIPERHKILVVEDKKEMADFIASVFAGEADVIIAPDGLSGLQKAADELPDVIISDVMMPLMNGYEMLSRIKNEAATCHIPVVLLSAKSRDEDRITGYDTGADLYMAKPFNPQVLRSAVNSILAKIERQKHQVVSTAGTSQEPVADEMSPLDRKFLTKLYAYINENIANSDLNVNLLGRDLGFSRTNFYRKIKALTGVTPNELLRVCRLNRAAQLLCTREYTIGEISDMTGFGTQSHFSNLFKKQFGVTPSAYPASVSGKAPAPLSPDDNPPVPLS